MEERNRLREQERATLRDDWDYVEQNEELPMPPPPTVRPLNYVRPWIDPSIPIPAAVTWEEYRVARNEDIREYHRAVMDVYERFRAQRNRKAQAQLLGVPEDHIPAHVLAAYNASFI